MSAALPHLPYPVTLPTLSEQISEFESSLGGPLFHRSPFSLTALGRQLVEAFPTLIDELLAATTPLNQLGLQAPCRRLAADPAIGMRRLEQILPDLTEGHEFRLDLHWRPLAEYRRLLSAGEADLVITTQAGVKPPGAGARVIASHRLTLLAPQKSRIRSAADLWNGPTPTEPLILPGEDHAIAEVWRRGLERGGLIWPGTVTVNAVETLQALVGAGRGLGLILGEEIGSRSATKPEDRDRKTDDGEQSVGGRAGSPSRPGSNGPQAPYGRSNYRVNIGSEPPSLPPANTADDRKQKSRKSTGLREIPLPGFDPVAIICLKKT